MWCACRVVCMTAGSVLQLLTLIPGDAGGESSTILEELVPRLWPLFRHPLTKVRLATVQCLQALLEGPCPWLNNDELLQTALR